MKEIRTELVSHTPLERLVFEILVTCDEVCKESKAQVELIPRDHDCALYFNGVKQTTLGELTKDLGEDSNARISCKYLEHTEV